MQFEITDRAALVFAGEFYAAVADGYAVDAALAEARKAIYADDNDVEWATPCSSARARGPRRPGRLTGAAAPARAGARAGAGAGARAGDHGGRSWRSGRRRCFRACRLGGEEA